MPQESAQEGEAHEQAAGGLGDDSFDIEVGGVHSEINHAGEGQCGIGHESGSGAIDGDTVDDGAEVARGIKDVVVIDGVEDADGSRGVDPSVVNEAFDGGETTGDVLDGAVDGEVWVNGGLARQAAGIELEFNGEREDQVGKTGIEGGLIERHAIQGEGVVTGADAGGDIALGKVADGVGR